ncbi:MAG: sulfatase [Euryarchaeota archaeon]|nr:sulfatase [Euryarchaeota archaeon]
MMAAPPIRAVRSLVDIAPTIAELLSIPLPGADGVAIPELTDCLQRCDRAVLILVDSLGYFTYQRLQPYMPHIRGTVIRCRAVADHTTPAIASILTGCRPDTHRTFTTADVCTSPIKSILELAEESGIRSAVVIEREGARAMKTKIDLVAGVDDSRDILDYDTKIKERTIELLKHEPVLMVVHFRAIDRYAHEARSFDELSYAAERIDNHLCEICRHLSRNTCVIVCGDHPIHGTCIEGDQDVALIVLDR